jgi:short-subunit dehydrogenase
MEISGRKFLLLGASGGIGRRIMHRLVAAGGHAVLVGRNMEKLQRCRDELEPEYYDYVTLVEADFIRDDGRKSIVDTIRGNNSGIDGIINCAGISQFGLFADGQADEIEAVFQTNVIAPLILIHNLIPELQKSSSAHIMNVGSIFGSIGFPGFCLYSSSKFALRGFSEALARELADSEITVSYVAPRATRTDFNTALVVEMNRELGVAMDDPDNVARQIIDAIRMDRKQMYLGWPERLFVKLNSLFPSLVDYFLNKQLPVIRRHARSTAKQQETYT